MENSASPGSLGQGSAIINRGSRLTRLPPWALLPQEEEAAPFHTQGVALPEPHRQLEGDRARAEAPSWHRWPWGSCPPGAVSLTHVPTAVPLLSTFSLVPLWFPQGL